MTISHQPVVRGCFGIDMGDASLHALRLGIDVHFSHLLGTELTNLAHCQSLDNLVDDVTFSCCSNGTLTLCFVHVH